MHTRRANPTISPANRRQHCSLPYRYTPLGREAIWAHSAITRVPIPSFPLGSMTSLFCHSAP